MDFNQYINNAINDIDEEIAELQQQRKEILSINESTICTDKEFQHICRTPLRSSNILAIFVKNIFLQVITLINLYNSYLSPTFHILLYHIIRFVSSVFVNYLNHY